MNLLIKAHGESNTVNVYRLDDSFVVESELALFAEHGAIRHEIVAVPPYEKSYRKDNLTARREAPDKAIFLAFLDDSLAGRIVLSEGLNGYAWVDDIAVDVRHRRKGVGRALMDRAIDWAAARGLPGLRLETQHNNVPACRFYASCGFRLGGFDRDLYRGLARSTNEIALFWYLLLAEQASR